MRGRESIAVLSPRNVLDEQTQHAGQATFVAPDLPDVGSSAVLLANSILFSESQRLFFSFSSTESTSLFRATKGCIQRDLNQVEGLDLT